MSSREIAEVTGKRHADVLRDIKSLISQGAILESSFALMSYEVEIGNGAKRSLPMYSLDFQATMTLVTGYNAVLRSKVISRWTDLEQGKAQADVQPVLPQSYTEALEALLETAKAKESLEAKIEEDKPLL